ncbi:hypothetical protein L1857_19850 [Amycolatopsis thermalba]|uniref:Uncharacterized protein n=1 Tax=Amycolatopsis thermalba TaxID=944492 RepID=A0ABY4NXX6_9PSEU|nr:MULTISPECIES: hypothetical protein [Amycolatopsis]UQS24903.1 hypothetical protein L1857_19850 [Amycolatopsis thermalba]
MPPAPQVAGEQLQQWPDHLMAELAWAVPPGEGDLPASAERLFDYHRARPEALRPRARPARPTHALPREPEV